MELFKELNTTLDSCDIVITMKKKDKLISVSVYPKFAKKENDLKPMLVSGTCEYLDSAFLGLIKSPLAETTMKFNNIESYVKDLKAKEPEVKNGKGKPIATKKNEPVQAALEMESKDNDEDEDNESDNESNEPEDAQVIEETIDPPKPTPAPQPSKNASVAQPIKTEQPKEEPDLFATPPPAEVPAIQTKQEPVIEPALNLGEDW